MVKKLWCWRNGIARTLPLMDIGLSHISGVEATRQITKKLPQSTIIGMSLLYSLHNYNAMMAAGAVAFVRKEDAVEV